MEKERDVGGLGGWEKAGQRPPVEAMQGRGVGGSVSKSPLAKRH